MNYFEFTFNLDTNTQIEEDVAIAFLSEIEFESFCTEDRLFKAYVSETNFSRESLDQFVSDYKIIESNVNLLLKQNWNAQWESSFSPVEIDDSCIIRAKFHDINKKYEYDIIIEPKMSFGTGHHETTSLMIKEMLRLDIKGKTVVDCGCGTGILGIFAAMKAAKDVFAFDIDDWCYENAMENIALNNVHNMNVKIGGIELLIDRTFDIILANINKNILIESMTYFYNSLNNGGVILFSGIYHKDLHDLKQSACSVGLKFVSFSENNSWISCRFIRQEEIF